MRTLDTDREHLHSHTKWLQRALEWRQKLKSQDLLLRGSEFIVAKEWLHQTEEQQKKPGVTSLQKAFIEASQKAINAVEEEEKRRQAEMLRLQEEKTKEAEARLAEQKKSARQQKVLLAFVSMGLVTAVGFAVLFFRWQQEAIEAQIRTLSQSSLLLNKSDRKFDALLEGIRAAKVLKGQWNIGKGKPEINELVLRALQPAVYGREGFREGNRLTDHKYLVFSVAFSPDGQTIASASHDRTIKLWNHQGQLLQTLTAHEAVAYSVAFSPDGQMIAASSGNTVKLWNFEGELLQTFQGHENSVVSVAFSPDSGTLASGSWDTTVILWELADLTLDSLMGDACAWVGDYLKYNAPKDDKTLCNDIK